SVLGFNWRWRGCCGLRPWGGPNTGRYAQEIRSIVLRLAMDESWLTAGAFARRSRLSAKALRLYAINRLLVPARIDASSGYRLYHESQLRDARLICMLRRA